MPRDQHAGIPWPQHIHQEHLGAGVGDEDFTKFLDLENEFEQFQQVDDNIAHSSLETPMGRLAFGQAHIQEMGAHNQDIMQNIDIAQYQPYPMYQVNQPHHYQVPPTPVSAEMHAGNFSGPIDNTGQIVFERHQTSFTPLVSPAQTPNDNAFGIPDYMIADEFFSPITSPAIEAQANFASTNATASPVDLNADQSAGSTPVSATRKRVKKANTSQQRSVRSVKQSPAMKPHLKRRQFSLSLSSDRLETMLEGQEDRLQPDPNRVNVFASSEDSVSPEPLSESLMRPPPLPSNLGRLSSNVQAQSSDKNLPATPAMIMRMPGNAPTPSELANHSRLSQDVMEDIVLPDVASSVVSRGLPSIDTHVSNGDDTSTPTLSAKTPKSGADSTPRISALKTQNNSNESMDKSKKADAKIGGRGSKKRPNDSVTISPALRPKISPSISPLAPAPGPGMSAMSAETSALYLASKSNYQNILDGTHLPGVSYPETLAENLSSKRTSHKIAEQGRRNRINLALKEIESLLPPSITAGVKKEKVNSANKDADDGSPDKPASSGQGTSKASTVEMAIVYIRNLQAELKETKDKLEEAEKIIAAGNSGGSQSPE